MTPSPATVARTYGGRSAEERRHDRRRRLLDAALELFGTAGYRASTLADLCRQAGVAPTHFYEEYAGREAMLEAIYDEIMISTRAEVDAALADAPATVEARIRSGVDAFCHALLDDPRRARIQCIEMVGVSPAMERRRHEGLLRYATLVVDSFLSVSAANAESVTLAPASGLRTIAIALVGGANEAIIDWLLVPLRPPISELVDALSELFEATARHLMTATP